MAETSTLTPLIEQANTAIKNLNETRGTNLKPISFGDLNSEQKPADVPTTPTPTQAGKVMDTIGSNADSFLKNLEQERAAAEKNKSSSFDQLLESLKDTQGKTNLTAREYERTGVDQAKQELKDIANQVLGEQTSLRRTQERIRKNEAGLFGGAVEQELRRAETESLGRQADLAVIQLAKQGRYDSAKEIADRAVAAKLEDQKLRNETLQFIYNDVKDTWSRAEQREFETKQADRNRKLEMDAQKEMARYDMLLKQQDPLYQAQLAKAYAELAGGGGIKLSETETRQARDRVQAGENLLTLAKEYQGLIDKYGYTNTLVGNQEVVGKVRALRGQMTAAYKDAKTLGTLDQGLLTLMDSIIGEEPTSTFNPLANVGGRASGRISSQIGQLIESTQREVNADKVKLGENPYQTVSTQDIGEVTSMYTADGSALVSNQTLFR